MPTKLCYQLDVDGQMLANCSLPCARDRGTSADAFLSGQECSIARYLVGIAAIACMLSSLFTVLTFIIDPLHFRYPACSIIFLSACYLTVGLAYVVGFAIGPRIACVSLFVGTEDQRTAA